MTFKALEIPGTNDVKLIDSTDISQSPFSNELLESFQHIKDFCYDELNIILKSNLSGFFNYKTGGKQTPMYCNREDIIYFHENSLGLSDYNVPLVHYQATLSLSHEVAHAIQFYNNLFGANIKMCETKIAMESQADDFAGWFMRYLYDIGIVKSNDIEVLRGFMWYSGNEIDPTDIELFQYDLGLDEDMYRPQIENADYVLYGETGQYHGTGNHRLNMFNRGFLDGGPDKFMDFTSFMPKNILEIESRA